MDWNWAFGGVVVAMGSIVGGFIGGGAVSFIRDYTLHSRVDGLETRFQRLHNELVSGSGSAAKSAKNERMSEAVSKAAELMQKGAKPEDALKEVAAAYPDVALSLLQKSMRNKGGIQGMLGNLMG